VLKATSFTIVVLVLALGCAGTSLSGVRDRVTATPSSKGQGPLNSNGSPKRLPQGPPSHPPYTLVLSYDDFGPQALCSDLLGFAWYQWETGGSWEIDDSFDVRVVVYRGWTRDEVMKRYPTARNQSDYRYVAYADAIAFLDRALHDETVIQSESLRTHLEATRARIRTELSGR